MPRSGGVFDGPIRRWDASEGVQSTADALRLQTLQILLEP